MCLGEEGKEGVKETSLSDHPGATVAVSQELGSRPLHSYTLHTQTGFSHWLDPGFP